MQLSRALHQLLHKLAVASFGALQCNQHRQRQQPQENSANGLPNRRDTIHIAAGSNVRLSRSKFGDLKQPLR